MTIKIVCCPEIIPVREPIIFSLEDYYFLRILYTEVIVDTDNSSNLNIPTIQADTNIQPLDDKAIIDKQRSHIWKDILLILILSLYGFFAVRLTYPLLFRSLGSTYTQPPFEVINIFAAILIFPFGFSIVLWFPVLAIIYYVFRRVFSLKTTFWNFILTLGISSILVITASTGLFYARVFQGKQYIQEKVSGTLQQMEEVVGSGRAVITYVQSSPSYSSTGVLESIKVTFAVQLPKVGEYGIDGSMMNAGYNLYDEQKPDIHIPSEKIKLTYDQENTDKEIYLVFNAQDLHANNYTGSLIVLLDVWRTGIEIKQPFGGTMDWARVEIQDSGKSSNVRTINTYGTDEPEYTISGFPLTTQSN